MSESIQVKVAGKIMLAGEYSVLRGHAALAMTVDRFFDVNVNPAKTVANEEIIVESDFWKSPLKLNINNLKNDLFSAYDSEYQAVVHLLGFLNSYLRLQPVIITIKSDLPPQFGLGSSSALRLAVISALCHYSQSSNQIDATELAFKAQNEFQKVASGYDIYTQSLGGLVEFYSANKFFKHPNNRSENLGNNLYFYGKLVQPIQATSDLINTNSQYLSDHNLNDKLDDFNKNLVSNFINYSNNSDQNNYNNLVTSIAKQRSIFYDSPHYHDFAKDLDKLTDCDQTWSFKTTGAGGSDLLLVLCDDNVKLAQIDQLANKHHWHRISLEAVDHPLEVKANKYEYS